VAPHGRASALADGGRARELRRRRAGARSALASRYDPFAQACRADRSMRRGFRTGERGKETDIPSSA